MLGTSKYRGLWLLFGLSFLIFCFPRRFITGFGELKNGPILYQIAKLGLEYPEVSGIVRSPKSGNYWVHNDSGNEPRIWAFDPQFQPLTPSGVLLRNARNWDWEDIAYSDGKLWLSDSGDNLNLPYSRTIYSCPEPNVQDPSVEAQVLVAGPVDTPWLGWGLDCEALVCWRGKPYLINKCRRRFRLDEPAQQATLFSFGDHNFTAVSQLPFCAGWVTAADTLESEGLLACLTQLPENSVELFRLPTQGEDLFSQPSVRIAFRGTYQCEALCFEDPDHVIIAAESGHVFRLDISVARTLLQRN
jgi:hypothetical protein